MRLLALVALACCGSNGPTDRLLVFSHTAGYRHADSIEVGTQVLTDELSDQLAIDATEDPTAFTADNLARYRAVAFLYTTGNDLLDADGKLAFEAFVRAGGGWLGLHSAADTEYEWPFYHQLVVAQFASHPVIQQATVTIADHANPATAELADTPWVATDEWYNFATNPRGDGVRVLATIDEASYTGGTMGTDHPMVWAHEQLGGRAFYSELGHVADRWHEPAFLALVLGGVRWVSGLAD